MPPSGGTRLALVTGPASPRFVPMTAAPIMIRRATAGDSTALSDVSASSWIGAYQGIIPHLDLMRFVSKRDASYWQGGLARGLPVLVLEVLGEIGGYACLSSGRFQGRPTGEITELYLGPAYQGIGLGEQLFAAARENLAALGLRHLRVWSLVANEPACAFYRRRGGRPGERSSQRFGSTRLERQSFHWS
ncbi:MAG: GNAT family N-acetyltransferase [Rhizobiales bacterium]|nr:GNAT family N-acetyltransferase [Hyphomicrobiales bacterium]